MIHKILLLLLLTIPISFKVELVPGVRFLIQEPFIVFFVLACNLRLNKVNKKALPFLFLAFSLFIIFFVSVFSLFKAFEPIGIVKTIKYLLYALAGFTILNNVDKVDVKVERYVLNIALFVVITSLGQYFFWFVTSNLTWSEFVSYSTWKVEYMPTGITNTIFDISSFEFKREGLNHGIYGSYLALMLILCLSQYTHKKSFKLHLLTLLILINIAFITSRETLLLIILTTLFFFVHYAINNLKFKKRTLAFFTFGMIGLIIFIVFWSPDLVILNKINHMVESFRSGKGFDNNVNYRFNTWYLYLGYALAHPWVLIFGIGNNGILFNRILDYQEATLNGVFAHASVPESFYVTTLAYGGLLSFLTGLIFFMSLFFVLYNLKGVARTLSFFVLSLMVTNATGASILAELLMSQTAIACLFVIQKSKKTVNQ